MKRRTALCGGIAAAIGGFPRTGAAADAEYTMRLGIPEPADSVFGIAGLHFAAAVQRRSGGRLKVEVYPNGQLAKQQETVDALATGVIDFAIQASAFLEALFPRYQVFNLPFLFKDLDAGGRVLDGPVGAELFAELETHGILGLAWGINGMKQMESTGKPIVGPEDLKGMRMRVTSGGVYLATYQALGAIPVQIDFSETYTALTQHTIDAVELPIEVFTSSRYYTAVKHLALTNHVLSVDPLIGSKRKIESLPPALSRLVKEEARAMLPFWRATVARRTADGADLLRKNGVAFTQVNLPAFRKAVEPVYSSFAPKIGADLIERVRHAGG